MRAWEVIVVACVVAGFALWSVSESQAEEAVGITECATFELPVNRADAAEWRHLGPMGTWVSGLSVVSLPSGYAPISGPTANGNGGYVIACRK
jgi:hypothetical protein